MDPETLRQLFRDGQYQRVVREAVKVLDLYGEAAKLYDRHEVIVLKAESHLRLAQQDLAADGFDDAAAVAASPEAHDIDFATARLIRQSKRARYVPRTGSLAGAEIDILEPDSRKKALIALFDDERAEAQSALDRAAESQRIAPLFDAVDRAAQLRQLERAARGDADESDKLLKSLSKRSRAMLSGEIKRVEKRVDQIGKSANKRKKFGSAYRKQGLAAPDPAELRELIKTCGQVCDAAVRMADSVSNDKDDFEAIKRDSAAAARHAQEVLTADYTGLYDRS